MKKFLIITLLTVFVSVMGGAALANPYPPDVSVLPPPPVTPTTLTPPLPPTGSTIDQPLLIAMTALVIGLGLIVVVRQRRHPATDA